MSTTHNRHPGVNTLAHIGLVVEDLDEMVRFLSLLGLVCGKSQSYSGEWTDRIMGLKDVTADVVMARARDGSDVFEVFHFRSPSVNSAIHEESAPAANRPGLRHIAFRVDDVQGVVNRLREAGWSTVGEVVGSGKTSLYCYVRGPDGLIVELAGGPTG